MMISTDILDLALVAIALALAVYWLVRFATVLRVFVAVCFVVIVAGLVPCECGMGPERAHRISCASNLSVIGKVTIIFQEDHTNQFPRSFQDLTNDMPPDLFVCKSSGHHAGPLTNVNAWTDYVFVSPHGESADSILAYCPPKNHKGKGGNILFADGHVLWVNADEFTNVLKGGVAVR